MKKLSPIIAIFFCILLSSITHAAVVGQTKVLLAKTPLGDSTTARRMLSQINTTFFNSGLGNDAFVSAASGLFGVPQVFTVTCSDTVAEDFLGCARTQLSAKRNEISADIVLVMVPFLDGSTIGDDICGSVMLGMGNAFTISHANEHLAYAAVDTFCLAVPLDGLSVTSHEVGHLLSIEHVADPNTNLPVVVSGSVENNHAAVNIQEATVTASYKDCVGFSCNHSDFFSEDGKNFPSGGEAGNSGHSNAVEVISTHSWPVVSTYRPLASPPSQPSCNYPYFLGCHQPGCAAWMFTFSANNATSYRIESRNLGVGSWIEEAVTSGPNYVAHRSGLPVEWRIQGVNSAGGGNFCYFWTTAQCEADDDPPDPF